MSAASVQARLDLTAIQGSVACFGSGEQAEYCAVVEVTGSQQSLAKVDDAKQEELLAAYSQFLNSLTFPFQLVVQVHPVDLGWYVTRVEERARALSAALVAIARDHAAFVQGLTRQRTLLERRIYVVVPWSSATELGPAASGVSLLRLLSLLLSLLRLRRTRHGTAGSDDQLLRQETISRQLTDRCEVIGRQLGRVGLRTTRLDDLGLAQLYHAWWAPEVARTQRLRRELADYTALVVGAEARLAQHRPAHEQRPGRAPA
jgi:hypothetical protein